MNALFFRNTKHYFLLAIILMILTGCSDDPIATIPSNFEEMYASRLSDTSEGVLLYTCHLLSTSNFKDYDKMFRELADIAVNRPDFNYLTMEVTYHWTHMLSGEKLQKSYPRLNKVSLQKLREFDKQYKSQFPKTGGNVHAMYSRKTAEWFLNILKTAGHDTRDLEWDIKEGIYF